MPSWVKWGDTPYQIWMTHTPGGTAVDDRNDQGEAMNRRIGYSGDAIAMYSHCGTHLDTLNHFGGKTWELAIPNGTYSVHLVAGDAGFYDSVYKIDAEGMRVVDGTPTGGGQATMAALGVPVAGQ